MKTKAAAQKTNVLLRIGTVLLVLAVLVTAVVEGSVYLTARRLASVTEALEARLPARTLGMVGERSDPSMPIVRLNSTDYLALIEFPSKNVCFPVAAEWDSRKAMRCPARFSGSAYDGILIIGASELRGQIDFVRKLDIGEIITVTDMRGRQYRYEIRTIKPVQTLDPGLPAERDMDLMLFTSSPLSSGYHVILCKRV